MSTPVLTSPASWVPVEWPAAWRDASLLRLLEGTPVNTLLLPGDASAAIGPAAAAKGLKVIAADSKEIVWRALKEVDWSSPGPIVAIGDAFWPEFGSNKSFSTSVDASAGPTGAPWLDSNGWLIQMARALAPSTPVWIRSKPPEDAKALEWNQYLLAHQEAFTFGAKRPLWLATAQAEALAGGNSDALEGWKRLMGAMAWDGDHAAWGNWPSGGRLVLASTFAGADEYMASETLLLVARRNLSCRVCPMKRLDAAQLRGARALLYTDEAPLAGAQLSAVKAFVDGGGLLIARKIPAAWAAAATQHGDFEGRFNLYRIGKGRVAVASADWDDPWVLASDTHLLMSKRHDPVRLYNGGSLQFHYTVETGSRRALVQLLNYTCRPSFNQVSVMLTEPVRSARLSGPGMEAQPVKLTREPGRQEVQVPPFPVYLALELELSNAIR